MKNKPLKLPPLIGLTGAAQSGKDTFFLLSADILNEREERGMRFAFADGVKQDVHSMLVKKAGLSAYTTIPEEKELIRPLLVAYGTNLMRRLDENYWIKRLELSLDLSAHLNATAFITDIRYPNEVEWLKEKKAPLIHISKVGNRPANKEEKLNDPILKKSADVLVNWKHKGDGETKSLRRKVLFALNKISCIEN